MRPDVKEALGRETARKQAPPAPIAGQPNTSRNGDEFAFAWDEHDLSVGVTQLHESSDGIHGEVTVQSGVLGDLHWGRLNLSSTTGRETLVRKLAKVHPGFDWRGGLERVCRMTADQFRAGAPIHPLMLRPEAAVPTTSRDLLERLLPTGQTAVLFGDGGSGKSLLALAVALAVNTGKPLPCGLRPSETVSVLFLDWESDRADHEQRLATLAAGLDVHDAGGIFYRPMTRGLADEMTLLRAEVSRRQIGLVIVDSFGPACGSEPEGADAAIRTMNALRSFGDGVTRLVVAHVSKLTAEQRSGASRPYGSVYVWNLARAAWEVRRSEEDEDSDRMALGLFCRKTNRGRKGAPIGLQIEFANGVTRLRAQDVAEHEDLVRRTSLAYRVEQILKRGARATEEIAEEVAASPDTVGRTLRRLHHKGKVVPLDAAAGGRGKAQRWGLQA